MSFSGGSSTMTNPVGGEVNLNPSAVSSGDTGLKSFVLFGVTITVSTEVSPSSSTNSLPVVVPPSSPPPDDDSWTVTKKLHQSDVDGSSRLLLGKKQVEAHIKPHIGEFEANRGVELAVFDVDTRTVHRLTLKKWKTESYVLLKGWTKDFVKRRCLNKNDEIGLRRKRNHLEFTVIRRADS